MTEQNTKIETSEGREASELSGLLSGWISVNDSLPDSGKRVLFAWMNNYDPPKKRVSIGFYAAKHELTVDHWEDEECADYDEEQDQYFCHEGWHEDMWEGEYFLPVVGVSHWMPEPQHPFTQAR